MYAWEKNVQRSWDALEEDEAGVLNDVSAATNQAGTEDAEEVEGETLVRRGMIRYVYFLLDLSRAMDEVDIRPTRISALLEIMQDFISAFFDENPLSNLGVLCSKGGMAERITTLSSSSKVHLDALAHVKTDGDFSLQNGLELAYTCMNSIPQYGFREVIVLQGSLTTCDPGNVFETIDKLKGKSIRCSVVGISAEVHVCKHLAACTKGDYSVALDKEHMRKLVLQHVKPPSVLADENSSLKCSFVKMGFPTQVVRATICSDTKDTQLNAYKCPRCHSTSSEIPSECRVCSLSLIASPHLARSYHHLFPVPRFKSVNDESRCATCTVHIPANVGKQCPKCSSVVCDACNEFIHDTLHNCPICLSA